MRVRGRVLEDEVRALLTRARREVDEGLLPSCQLALAHDGEIVAFETYGDATNDTRYVIFSSTKGLVNGAVWLLLSEGALRLDQRVAEIVPEFGANGKQDVTVEQVARHLSGFPFAFMNPHDWDDRDKRLASFASWTLAWEPGTRYWYHGLSAHYVLAEIVERLSGTDYRVFLRERILDPLGLAKLRLGVPSDEQRDVAPPRVVGSPPTREELESAWGIFELPASWMPHEVLLPLAGSRLVEIGIPAANAVSTAADLAMYYQAVLRSELWDADTLAYCTGSVQTWPDELDRPTSRAIGVQVNGDHGYGGWYCFGKTNSPAAFGHDGAGGMIAWADPATGLSFSYLTNGLDDNLVRQKRRGVGLSSRAASCAC